MRSFSLRSSGGVWLLGIVLALAALACGLPTSAPGRHEPIPPTPTGTAVLPAATPSLPPCSAGLTPQPGLLLRGYVRDAGGQAVAGVQILRAYASYSPEPAAQTDANGYFESVLLPIPGDEMVRVSARLAGFTVVPDDPSCQAGECYWRHYYGFEERVFYFTVQPGP